MRVRRGTALVGLCAAATYACTLFVDTGGLSTTPASSSSDSAVIDANRIGLDAAPDAANPALDANDSFTDDFNRADDPAIGNGWIEKTPETFSLVNQVVTKAAGFTQYLNNLVYRPTVEDRRDVEVAMSLVVSSSQPFPQIFARAQRASIASADSYDAYILFLNAAAEARVARQRGRDEEVALIVLPLSKHLVGGERVRLTLRVTGASPVKLMGLVEIAADGNWTAIGQGSTADGLDERLDLAGAVGFTAGIALQPALDDFSWRAVTP